MSTEIATNRKAPRDYHILEKYEAGLELRGTEVKSIRLGKLNISDAFARVERLSRSNFKEGGLFLEKYVERARHIEVQIFGDGRGQSRTGASGG